MTIRHIIERSGAFVSIVVYAIFFATTVNADSITTLALDLGHRSDDVNFNIASDITGNATPNIISELTWTSLKIIQTKLTVDHRSSKGSVLMASASYGSIGSGSNQDSDYDGDNRTLENSRSYNDGSGGDVVDLEIALGYQYDIYDSRSKNIVYVIPLVGFSYHEQNLRMTNGKQVLQLFPDLILQPFPGLNSTFQTEWDGYWLGAQLFFRSMASGDKFSFLFKHHLPDYYAEADWNLRTDPVTGFQHPKSYEHQASGRGNEFAIEWLENTTEVWALKMTLNYQKWRTDPGVIIFYKPDGTTPRQRLNAVEWGSTTFMIGLERRI